MNCSARRDLYPEYLLGLLEPETMQELRHHLQQGCPACAAALSEAETMLALLPAALPAATPPPAVRARLVARLAKPPAAGAAPLAPTVTAPTPLRVVPAAPDASQSLFFFRSIAIAAMVAIACLLMILYQSHQDVQRLSGQQQAYAKQLDSYDAQLTDLKHQVDNTLSNYQTIHSRFNATTQALVAATRTIDNLRSQNQALAGSAQALATATKTIDMLRAQNLVLVSLAVPGQGMSGARARALWDKDSQHWQLIATGLKPAGVNRIYELWFITSTQVKVPGGTFSVDASGQAILTVQVPHDIGVISVAAVTDEPGYMLQPTGKIALAGVL